MALPACGGASVCSAVYGGSGRGERWPRVWVLWCLCSAGQSRSQEAPGPCPRAGEGQLMAPCTKGAPGLPSEKELHCSATSHSGQSQAWTRPPGAAALSPHKPERRTRSLLQLPGAQPHARTRGRLPVCHVKGQCRPLRHWCLDRLTVRTVSVGEYRCFLEPHRARCILLG